MFYAGAFNNEPQQIGVVKSSDGIHWTRVSDEPFLSNGKEGTWNSRESGHPHIYTHPNGSTWLFHQGNNDHGSTWYLSNIEVFWNKNGLPYLNYLFHDLISQLDRFSGIEIKDFRTEDVFVFSLKQITFGFC